MGARALVSLSLIALGKRLALLAYARFWHPSGMQSSLVPVSGGRFGVAGETTTGYPLPTLRVGLTSRKAWEDLTYARTGTR